LRGRGRKVSTPGRLPLMGIERHREFLDAPGTHHYNACLFVSYLCSLSGILFLHRTCSDVRVPRDASCWLVIGCKPLAWDYY
jgi:hypothetical protein